MTYKAFETKYKNRSSIFLSTVEIMLKLEDTSKFWITFMTFWAPEGITVKKNYYF